MAEPSFDAQLAELTQITSRLQRELGTVQLRLKQLAQLREQQVQAEGESSEAAGEAVSATNRDRPAVVTPESNAPPIQSVQAYASSEAAVNEADCVARPIAVASPVPVDQGRGADAAKAEKGAGLELAIGGTWLNRIGAIALLVGMSFFVKYAFDEGWLSPVMRVWMGAAVGVLLVVVGEICLRRSMRMFASGVLGGGVGILYLAVFGAYNYYDLVSPSTAAFLYSCVTVLSVVIAVHGRLPWIAVLAIIGGYGTPFALSTGLNRQVALLSYVALLDVGFLLCATLRRWDVVRILAWLGTLVLFAGWYFEFYHVSALWTTWGFLLGFYLLFHADVIVTLYRRASRWPAGLGVIVHAGNIVFFGVTYLLWKDTVHAGLGLFAVLTAALQWWIAWRVLPKEGVPIGVRLAFWLGGAAMLSLAVPLQFDRYLVSVSWLVQGIVTLWFCRRHAADWLRVKAVGLLLAAVVHVFAYEFTDAALSQVFAEVGRFHLSWFIILVFAAGLAFYLGAAVLTVRRSLGRKDIELAWLLVCAGSVLLLWLAAGSWDRYVATWAWAALALAWLVLGLRVRAVVVMAAAISLATAVKFMLWDTLNASSGYWDSINGLVINRAVLAGIVCSGLLLATQVVMRRTSHPAIDKLAAFNSPVCLLLVSMLVLTWTGTFEIARAFCWESWPSEHIGEYRFSVNVYITAFWALNAVVLWWCAGRKRQAIAGYALFLTFLAVLKLMASDTMMLAFKGQWGTSSGICSNAQFIVGLLGVGAGVVACRAMSRIDSGTGNPLFGKGARRGLMVVVLLLSVWTPTYEILRVFRVEPLRLRFEDARLAMHVSISVLWSLHATGCLVIGFVRRVSTMRRFALVIYLVTIGKVFLFDLAQLAIIQRIVSFLVLGTLLLFASLLYQWLATRILAGEHAKAEQTPSSS